MSTKLPVFVAVLFLLTASHLAYGQGQAIEVSACNLARNPENFDKKMVRVRGTLNVYFEDFSLGTGNCGTQQDIWLAFGGDVPGLVPSTVNDNSRKLGSDIKVEGVSYGMKKDANFHRLYALIAARHGDKPEYRVTATLTGMFFAGVKGKNAKGDTHFSGFGHLGCCALFLIMQVSDVESVPPANLNLVGFVIGPNGKALDGFTVINDVLGGSPPERQTTVTDKQGQFSFSNSGQQLRFQDPRYRPLSVTVNPGGKAVRVKLEDAKDSDWVIQTCKEGGSGGRVGFSILFTLPDTMQSSAFSSEGMQSLFIHRRGTDMSSADLIIGHGPNQTVDAADSLGSEDVAQRWVKNDAGKIEGIDAEGRTKNGGYWHSASFTNGDTIRYGLRRGQHHKDLDRVINSACVAAAPVH